METMRKNNFHCHFFDVRLFSIFAFGGALEQATGIQMVRVSIDVEKRIRRGIIENWPDSGTISAYFTFDYQNRGPVLLNVTQLNINRSEIGIRWGF